MRLQTQYQANDESFESDEASKARSAKLSLNECYVMLVTRTDVLAISEIDKFVHKFHVQRTYLSELRRLDFGREGGVPPF